MTDSTKFSDISTDISILFVNPPWFGGSTFDEMISRAPPLGLAYLAAVLEKNGFNKIRVIDMKSSRVAFEELTKEISELKPDILGLTMATGQVSSGKKIIKITKAINSRILCIIGGPHSSALPEKTLEETNADACIFGEGEITVLELVKAVKDGKDFDSVKGIVFLKQGSIKRNPPRALIRDIDSLPFPSRHLLPTPYEYSRDSQTALTRVEATMITSRGCPFRCAFCDKSIFGKTFRVRSATNIADEIEFLVKEYGVQSIRFFDDLLTAMPKRVTEICDELKKRNIKIKWSCEARVNNVNPELLKKMKEAGCTEIHYGIESGNQKILDLQQKDITLDQIRNAVKWTNDAGINSRGYFIVGLPGDTKETILETIKFGKSLKLSYAGIFLYDPYPGTFDRKFELEDYGKVLVKDWDDYVKFNRPSFVPNGITEEELMRLYKRAYFEMHLNPRSILKLLQGIKRFSTLKSYVKGFFWSVGLKK